MPASRSWAFSLSIVCWVVSSVIFILSSGYFFTNELRNNDSRYGATVGIMPSFNSPLIYPFSSPIIIFMRSASCNIIFACLITASPAVVGTTGCLLLSKFFTSNSSSRFWIIILRLGWITKQASAAFVKCRQVSTGSMYFKRCIFNLIVFIYVKVNGINFFYKSPGCFYCRLLKFENAALKMDGSSSKTRNRKLRDVGSIMDEPSQG